MNSGLSLWGQWLADFELAATVLLGVTLIAMRWIRQPAQRVALGWVVSLALLVLLAVTAVPAWPRWHAPTHFSQATQPLLAAVSSTRQPEGIGRIDTVTKAAPMETGVGSARFNGGVGVRTPELEAGNRTSMSIAAWLGRLFLLGVAVAGGWLVLGWGQAAWICRRARPAPARLSEQLRALAGNDEAPPRLLLSSQLHNAVAVGIIRPTILLPAGLAERAPAASLRAVLAHEVAHIRNRDLWLVGLLRMLLTVLFPQPLFWILRGMIRASQEAVADAVAAANDRHDYADGLIGWLRQGTPSKRMLAVPAVGIWEKPTELSDRIALLIDGQFAVQTSASRRWRVWAAMLVGAMALGVSVLTVRPAATGGSTPAATGASLVNSTGANANSEIFIGRVVDKSSRGPIEGALVHVRREISSSTAHRTVEETEHITDSEGRFQFNLSPEFATNRYAYLNFEVTHSNYARLPWNGYSLAMIRKNKSLGAQPFFEDLEMTAAEGISGTLVRPDGSAAAGVKILTYSKARKDDMADYGSFAESRTDGNGFFQVNVVKGGEAVLWLLPHDFVPSTHLLHQQRGNLGRFTLQDGIRLSGQALNNDGSPAGSVWVNAELSGGPAKQRIGMPVIDALSRSALTDGQGRFAMEPLPAGDYQLLTSEYPRDSLSEDHTFHPVPDTFVHQDLNLADGQTSASVELRAVPHVMVTIQQTDSQGRPHKSHEIRASGQLNGNSWWGEGLPDDTGKIVLKVPRGLADARLDILVNEHQATRHRWASEAPWSNENQMTTPVLDHDYPEATVIYYTAPVLLVRATAADGSTISGFKCRLEYAEGRKPYTRAPNWISGVGGDVDFEKEADGRWRSEGLLPDENLRLTVEAEGYQSYSQPVNLPEGSTREVEARLQRL
jgi:beta-lactamase regulating signal transducer with metallopeptidase domain